MTASRSAEASGGEVEEELRRQRERFEPVLEISPSAIVITDLKASVVAWNPAAEQLFGYTAEEAIGRNLDDLVAKTEELHKAAVAYSERARGREHIRTVTRRSRKDGTLVDVEVRAAPLLANGEPIGTFGVYHDVTELHRQRRFYEALLDVSPAAIVAIDPRDNVTLWNPAAQRLFGFTSGEAIGRNVDDLVANNDDVRAEAERLNRTAEGGEIRTITRRTRKDGSLVDVELLGAPVTIGDELVARYAIYLDISELERRKQYYEALVELSPTAITTVDPHDRVTSWNPAAERLFGYAAEEAVGRNIDDLVTNRDDLHDEGLRISEEISEREVQLTARRTRKDGSLVDVAVTAAPIFVGGQLIGKYALYHDVSELQEQRRYYQAVVDLSPTAIVTVDEENLVTRWNPAAQRLFGYASEEAVGRDLDDLVGQVDDIHEEAERFTQEMARGKHVRAISRRTRKDGSLIDVEMLGAPVMVAGERVGHLVIYHDISEIQEQRRYYEALLEVSPTAIATVDRDNKVTSWNPAAEQTFGYSAEEAIGRNLDGLVASSEEIKEEASRLTREGQSRRVSTSAITRRTRKDGTFVDVQVAGVPVSIGDEWVGDVVMYHDVTQIQEQRRYLESLLELSPTAIVVIDKEGRVTSWNPAAEELFGYPPQEAIGQNLDDLVAKRPDLHEEGARFTEAALRGERIHAFARRTRKDGSLVDVELISQQIVVGDELRGFLAIYHDVTELQRQKRFYESLLQLSDTAIVTADDEFHVTSWNPAAERLFGYTADEAIGRNIDDLVANSPDVRQEAVSMSLAGSRGDRARAISRRTRKDGTLVDVEIVAGPVYIAGERVGHSIIYHDIGEIQRQRRYYESLLETSPTAIMTVDLDAIVTSWNPAAEQLLGYTREEAIGKSIDDLVANNDEIRKEAEGVSERARLGGQVHLVTRRTRKDGSLVDVDVVAAPIVIGGETVGYYAMYSDISELQRQRRYYEALVDVSPVAVVLYDTDGIITSWSPAAERLFGYTPEQVIGRSIIDVVASDSEVREEAEGYLQQMQEGAEAFHAITRRVRRDGTLVDVEIHTAPVVMAGERVGFYVLYHDISDLQRARRDAEVATEAKSAFLATMSHEIRTPLNAVIGMTGLLLDTRLTAEQHNYAEVIRSSGDALLGVINDILDFSKIEAGRLELENAPFDLRECVESALELVAAGALKKGLDLAYDLEPTAPGALVGDVTRLRQILINLLNNSVKFTERGEVVVTVSAERLDSDDRHRLLFAVRDTGIGIPPDRMDRLFESFSQVDRSTTRRYGGTGLGLAISKRLVELMGGRLWAESQPGTGSTFSFTIVASAAPAPLRAYERTGAPQLVGKRVLVVDDNATNRQILARQTQAWNMLPAATESPGEALEWIQRGDPFDVAILDMQMPDMDGLTLAREIRRYRGARTLPLVMLTSLGRAERAPAEFAAYLTKPIKPSQLYDALMEVFGATVQLEEPQVGPGPDEHMAERVPLRILVVEDNAVNQQLALLLLKKVGYRADVAANGVEALEALERQPYDVVLMDVEMPEMDGLEATRRIHQRWPGGQRPHIVAVTANAMEGERELCIQAGMDDYITKPIRFDELAGALTRGSRRTGHARPASAVDGAVIRRLVASLGEGGRKQVAGLIETFLEHLPGQVANLGAAVERRDIGEVRREAHTLKSNAASFGAPELASLCRDLEASAKSGALEGAADQVARVEGELKLVAAELEALRRELRG